MAEGLSESTANGLLSAIFQGVSFSVTTLWAQKHVGAPGAAGTANIAADTARVNVSTKFGVAPSGGQIANDAVFGDLASAPASETYTHITFWTASTAGTFIGSGTITATAVTSGSPWAGVPVGDCIASFPIAS